MRAAQLRFVFAIVSLSTGLLACAVDDGMTKDEARAQAAAGKADHVDWCDVFAWYGDGECDDFCANPDPDCAPAGDVPACEGGALVAGESAFVDSADGRQCELPGLHCLTSNHGACPQLSPLSPDFCKDGTIVPGPAHFIAAADGMECQMPSVHCVTKDHRACPQPSPLPPDFCAGGTVVPGTPTFAASADGKECQLPSVHCVTADPASCPQS